MQAKLLESLVAMKNGVDMDIVVHRSIDSTNNWSLQQCREGKVMPFACFAEEQELGRGRRGKQWLMVAGANIAMSVTWLFDLSPQQLQLLPLSIALAVVDTLEKLNLKHVQIKWPNDVYVRDKKIAGILIDARVVRGETLQLDIDAPQVSGGQTAMVIGVGLNYDMSLISTLLEQNHQLMPELTDVSNEVKRLRIEKRVERCDVAGLLLQNVIDVCQHFQCEHNRYLERFRARYDYCKNKDIEVMLDDGIVLPGVAQGVSDNAELLVLIDGQQQSFNSAEISVRATNNVSSEKSDTAQ